MLYVVYWHCVREVRVEMRNFNFITNFIFGHHNQKTKGTRHRAHGESQSGLEVIDKFEF
jgi:hypothetical protein